MDTLPEAKACRTSIRRAWRGARRSCSSISPAGSVARRSTPTASDIRCCGAGIRGPDRQAERDGWLACFNRALDESIAQPALREAIREPVTRLAVHMQNKT